MPWTLGLLKGRKENRKVDWGRLYWTAWKLCRSSALEKTAGVQQINKSAAVLPVTVKSKPAVNQKYTVSISLNRRLLNTSRTGRQLWEARTSVVFSKDNCAC